MPSKIITVLDEEENDYPELANFLNLCNACSKKALEIADMAELSLISVPMAGIIDHMHTKCQGIHYPIQLD